MKIKLSMLPVFALFLFAALNVIPSVSPAEHLETGQYLTIVVWLFLVHVILKRDERRGYW